MLESELVIGNTCRFKDQIEVLVYKGRFHNWYQFALVSTPNKVWSEVLAEDLDLLEAIAYDKTQEAFVILKKGLTESQCMVTSDGFMCAIRALGDARLFTEQQVLECDKIHDKQIEDYAYAESVRLDY